MTFPPLPYLSRPDEEAHLRDFLLERLQPQAGLPKALLLSGPPGVGKRTLLQRVLASDPRLRAYQFGDMVTQKILAGAQPEGRLDLAVDVATSALGLANPVVAATAGVGGALLKHHHSRKPAGESPRDPFLEGTSKPLLLVVPAFDPEDQDALRQLGHRINQARDRALPRALLILDDSSPSGAEKHHAQPGAQAGISHRLQRLREYLEDNHSLEVRHVGPFTEAQCRDAFLPLGLSAEWARLLYQLSDGGITELRALWEALQEGGLFVPEGDGRWKAIGSPSASMAAKQVQLRIESLVESRLPRDSPHWDRLIRACHLAACMGSAFLPQAVAEAVVEASPKREEIGHDAWEDAWYHVLEHEDAAHPSLAAACMSDDRPQEVQADGRRCFVYAFRDPVLVSLLRAAARQQWDAWKTEPGQPNGLLVGVGVALERWLGRTFAETWPEALPFRAALLRIQRREWEASRMEDLAYRIGLEEKLRLKVEEERRRVQQGKDAGDLYAALLWYAETLNELGHSAEEATALREAMELVGAGRVASHRWDRLQLQNRLGLALFCHGEYNKAEPLLADVLQQLVGSFGYDYPDTLTSAHGLAGLYLRQGRYTEAEPLFQRALEGHERLLGQDHPSTLTSANKLASLYFRQGRYTEAEPLLRRALEGRGRRLGQDHPETLTSANNLASLYERQGHYTEAEPLLRHALEGRERLLGQDHPDTLTSGNNLAGLYERQGRYTEAEPLLRHALEGRERLLGQDHPDTLTSAHGLAVLYLKQDRYTEAEPLIRHALEGHERLLGPDHPDTLSIADSLAGLYLCQGPPTEAESLYLRALKGRDRLLGPDHPDTLTSANNLAGLYLSQGRYMEAEPLYLRALEGCVRVLGSDHPHSLTSANTLAWLYLSQGRYTEAEPLYLQILEGCERQLGPEHPITLQVREDLDSLRRQMTHSQDP